MFRTGSIRFDPGEVVETRCELSKDQFTSAAEIDPVSAARHPARRRAPIQRRKENLRIQTTAVRKRHLLPVVREVKVNHGNAGQRGMGHPRIALRRPQFGCAGGVFSQQIVHTLAVGRNLGRLRRTLRRERMFPRSVMHPHRTLTNTHRCNQRFPVRGQRQALPPRLVPW
jgi:hypothetical protein